MLEPCDDSSASLFSLTPPGFFFSSSSCGSITDDVSHCLSLRKKVKFPPYQFVLRYKLLQLGAKCFFLVFSSLWSWLCYYRCMLLCMFVRVCAHVYFSLSVTNSNRFIGVTTLRCCQRAALIIIDMTFLWFVLTNSGKSTTVDMYNSVFDIEKLLNTAIKNKLARKKLYGIYICTNHLSNNEHRSKIWGNMRY